MHSRLRSHQAAALEALLVVAAFTGVAVFATWPLAAHPLGGFYGWGNDNWGGMPYFDWIHRAQFGPGSPSFDPELQAPFGFSIPAHAIQPMDRLFAIAFGGFGHGLGAYNAEIFLSFVLSGCTMYLLARYVTRSRLAALIAGFAYTFSPFHLALAMQYGALASIQWIPLYLLALIVLLRRGRRRDAALTGAAFALVVVTSYYYAWFVGWFTLLVVAFFAVAWLVRRRRGEGAALWPAVKLAVSRGAVAGGVAVGLALLLLLPSIRSAQQAGTTIVHPLSEGIRYSARPWMFFIPPEDNPLLGDHVLPWVQNHLFDSPVYEQAIYLGYTLLALGTIALLPARYLGALNERARFARPLLVAGFIAAGLIMIGPYIPFQTSYWKLWETPNATFRVPSLPWLMFHLGPEFRFFVRAFVLVSGCLAVLAAIGFARIERDGRMTRARSGVLAAIVLTLIALEFTNAPPHVWFSAKIPPWVAAVRRLPPNASLVEYPVASLFTPRSAYYLFWQTKTERPDTNPPQTAEAQALALAIAAPDDPGAGAALHHAGIDYAVVHTRLPPATTVPFQPQFPDDSMPRDAGALNPWFKLVARTPDAVIYRVRAAPVASRGAIVRAGSGFGASEPEGRSTARWLYERTGDLTLFVAGKRRPIDVVLTLSSFAQPRRVSLTHGGRRLASFLAPGNVYTTHRVALGSLAPGRYDLTLASQPGPQSIQGTIGGPDTRAVSIRLREPVLVRSR